MSDSMRSKRIPTPRYVLKSIRRDRQLYLVLFIPLLYIVIFQYIPIYGVQIAFKDFFIRKGITGSPWVGLKWFLIFFNSPQFGQVISNTIRIAFFSLVIGFPMPILLAISLNECRALSFKKTVQMVTYAPFFISTVIMVAIIIMVIDPRTGLLARLAGSTNMNGVSILAKPELFTWIYVLSGVWQQTGWGSIIYLAALSGIDPQLYDAAIVDGATRMQKIRHIDLPGLAPTIIILLILASGEIMTVGFEKVFLLQNNLNLPASEVIATYIYKVGLVDANYSFSAAVGLFNSAINFVILVVVNQFARRLSETSLW